MNFYTSNSRYLLCLVFLVFAYLALSTWSEIYVIQNGLQKDNDRLLYVQNNKIEREKGAEIVFVGDSSLGNSIDARLVEKETGLKTLNLALTGSFGYAGSLNMALHAYDKNRGSLKYIVIMQTLDIPGRGTNWDMYRKTKCLVCDDGITTFLGDLQDRDSVVSYLSSVMDVYLNKNYIEARFKRIYPTKDKKDRNIILLDYNQTADYFAQGNRLKVDKTSVGKTKAPKLEPNAFFYIRRLNEFCMDRNIRCLYAHGPMYEGVVKKLSSYIAFVNSEISENLAHGVSGGPYLLKEDELGDSYDHARPSKKEKTTRFYIKELFAELLTEKEALK